LQSEGRERLQEAAATMTDDTPAFERARIWLSLAILRGTAEPARSLAASDQAIELYRHLGDALRLGRALAWRARIWVFMGKFDEAAPVFAEALALAESVGNPRAIGGCLEGDGFRKMLTGDLAGARDNFERALAQFRAAGATSAVLGVLVNLGDLSWALGDLDAALAQCREAVRLMRDAPHFAKAMLGTCLTNLSGVLTERGELSEALAAAREGLPLRRDSGHSWVAMDSFALRAGLAGKLDNAARIAGYADATHAAKQSLRQPNEARARARLMDVLREHLDGDEIARLTAAGAAFDEDEACRIALEE